MTEKELLEWLEVYKHKIRNPLHAIGLNLDVLKNRLKRQKDFGDQLVKHVDIVIRESKQIERLTASFIDFLKMPEKEREGMDLKSFLDRGTHG